MTSARVTDVDPNTEFKKRMRLRQQAAADRAIAREQRIQEEEQRLLAIAKGEREVAERQAHAKVRQIEQTTNAETEKQLAITSANKLKEQAEIDRERSVILLEKAEIDAEAVKVAADAEAYAKAAVLEADNALAQKLDAEIRIQRVWAEAYANAMCPPMSLARGMAIRQQVAIKRRSCYSNSWPWNTQNDWITIAQSKNKQNLGPKGPIFLVMHGVSG